MANPLVLAWDLVAVDHASPTFGRVGAAADSTAGSVRKLMEGFGALAVGGAVVVAVKQAAEFQKQMTLVQTQAGATAAEVRKLTPAILSLAGQTAQAPEALANSLYHVESTGLRGKAALDAVRIAAEGAKVGNADLEQTTNALTATIASGMLPATETYAQAMGQLNTIVGSGDMKMQDLNDALSMGLLVTVKQYGVTMNDVGAALADFGDNNLRGADAATRLRMAVQAISTPGKNAAGDLAKIGLTVQQLQSDQQTGGLNKALTDLHTHLVNSGIDATQWGGLLTDAFTKKAGAGVLTLIGTFDRFQQKYQEISKGANSFGDAWTATTHTASFQFAQLKDTVDALGIKLGTALLKPLGDLAGWLANTGIPDAEKFGSAVGDVGHGFMQLPSPIRDTALALGALALAEKVGLFDRLGTGVGNVRSAFQGFRQEMQLQQALWAMNQRAVSESTTGFSEFGGLVSRSSTSLEEAAGKAGKLEGAFGTLTARGVAGLKAGMSGLMGMFGGPWGVAIAGVTLGIGALQAAIQHHDAAVKQATADVQKWNEAIAMGPGGQTAVQAQQHIEDLKNKIADLTGRINEYNAAEQAGYARGGIGTLIQQRKDLQTELDKGTAAWKEQLAAMTPVEEMQARLDQATHDFNMALKDNPPNSQAVVNANIRLHDAQKALADETSRANDAAKTQIQREQDQANAALGLLGAQRSAQLAQMQLSDAIDQYNSDAKDGQHTTRQLKEEQLSLVDSAQQAAQKAADAAAAQAKQNGATDTGSASQAAFVKSLQESAAYLDGDAKQAVLNMIATMGAQADQAHLTAGAINAVGVTVTDLPNEHLITIDVPTDAQMQKLHDLRYATATLPNGKVVVTADTNPAQTEIQDLLNYARSQSIIWRSQNLPDLVPNVSGGGRLGGPATGGWIAGPGTPTSDTAGIFALSNGEFVVNAAAAQAHASLLEAINGGGRVHTSGVIPGKATGGWVNVPAGGWYAGTGNIQTGIDEAGAKAAINGMMTSIMVAAGGSGGAARWAPLVLQALAMEGQPSSLLGSVLRRMNQESGGNPNAINLWDSNAAAGDPSRGLMQTIGSTFSRYHYGGTSWDIYDPMANVLASMNYALARYGSLSAAYDRPGGYKLGTNWVPQDGLRYLHRGEAVVPADQNKMGAPYQDARGPLMHVEHQHINDQVDIELALREAQFRERTGAFS